MKTYADYIQSSLVRLSLILYFVLPNSKGHLSNVNSSETRSSDNSWSPIMGSLLSVVSEWPWHPQYLGGGNAQKSSERRYPNGVTYCIFSEEDINPKHGTMTTTI